MFVSKVYLREFRGIKDCEKAIELSKFTVLIGRNDTGKSAILEALSLLPHPHIESNLRPGYRINIIFSLHGGKDHGDEDTLVYGYAGNFIVECHLDLGVWTIEGNYNNVTTKVNGKSLSPEEIYKTLNMTKDECSKSVVFIPNNTQILKELDNKLKQYKNFIMKIGAHVRVAKVLSECVSDRFTEVYLDTMKIRKELPDGNVFYISLDDLGDGIKKAVRVMLLIEAMRPKLILWDDFEVFVHPSLITILLKWLLEGDWQVVISTHSIDVLYELVDLGKDKDVSVLILEKDESDILHYRKISIDELEDLIVANQDPRRMAHILSLR